MLLNHLKIALRTLWRQKTYSFINLISLALGLACSILIFAYVRFELSYDEYHENKDRLYRLVTRVSNASYASHDGIAKVTGPWGIAAKAEIPEIEDVTRFVFVSRPLLAHGEKRFYEPGGKYVDPSIFSLFSFSLLEGDPKQALVEPNTIVLTRDLALKYFDNENPVGQTILMDNQTPLRVTGVMENVPLNSHFTFRFLLSMSTLTHPDRDHWIRWNQFYTYVLLRPGADPSAIKAKMPAILVKNMGEQQGGIYQPYLQQVTDIHLRSDLFREMEPNSDIASVTIMSGIALFILMIGCMNFMNIATARASKRAREVGVRKVTGADRASIARQFLAESLLLSFLGLLIAVAFVESALPLFNELTSRHIAIEWFHDGWLMAGVFGLTVLVGLIAGSYPSFVLSSFKPVQVLKGELHSPGGKTFRKVLVIAQFAVSGFFLIATGVVFDQLSHIRGKKFGFNQEQLIIVPMSDPALAQRADAIKSELLQHPSIVAVSATANLPGGNDFGIPAEPVGIARDHDLISTLQVELAQGRLFSKEMASDATSGFIINEEALRQLGWANPLQERIAMPAIGRAPSPVLGVVKDFHFRSLHEKIAPLLFFVPPPEWFAMFAVRVQPGRVDEALAFLEKKFAEFDPNHPFRHSFLDEQFAQLHESDQQMGRVLTTGSAVAVVLACLGLFGLATFSAEARTKEIGVRKVLGASVSGIASLMTRDFLKLVILANLLSWPIAWFAMSAWLEDFAYRTDINIWTFVAMTLGSVFIAALTVSAQAVKAGLTNPVKALRYE